MMTPRTLSLLRIPSLGLALFAGLTLLLFSSQNYSPTTRQLHAAATPDSLPEAQTNVRELTRPQLLERLGVAAWHRLGQTGKGIKVAVLDSGFSGYRQQLGKALPEKLTVHSCRRDGNLEAKESQHGILCGEVIHTLAPDAELLFANWDADQPETFVEALRWARQQGAKVATCSVIMPTWSDGEGHGATHAALKKVLGDDMLLFACAGNTAQRHWSGPFRDAGVGVGEGVHDWQRGNRWNAVKPWGSERVSVELCAQPGGDYEVILQDETTDRILGSSETKDEAQRPCAVVRFWPQEGHSYRLKVRLVRGAGKPFHLVVLGGGLEHVTASGSIPFPGDGEEVIAVGAVTTEGRRCAYSSCGPNSTQPKPDLVATVPFPSSWRTRSFSGTSAAAPQAAALAALVWARQPKESAQKIRETLRAAAAHLGMGQHDPETGFGLIHLP